MGLPGAVGSIDCTHVWWDRCPVNGQNDYIGKEGFPTVAYEVIVDHNRRILFATKGFPGSNNDKTICSCDAFVHGLRTRKLYNDVDFEIEMNDGTRRLVRQVYLICDGGYPNEPIFINPFGSRWLPSEVYWSEWLESVRKDVECTFGILKGRWRILKNAILLQTQQQVDDVFHTCCMLHNILLKFDGLDKWEDVDWNNLDPDDGRYLYNILYYEYYIL